MDAERIGRRLSRAIWDELPLERTASKGRNARRRIREALLESVEVVLSEEARRYGRPRHGRRDRRPPGG